MNKLNVSISKYPNKSSYVPETAVLRDELENIRIGKYKNEVISCRRLFETGDKIQYKKNKSALPAITFSGLFQGSHKSDNLIKYSNFMIIDIDAIEKSNIDDIRHKLFLDDFIVSVWLSPSGQGLKVLVNVSNDVSTHKTCFDVLSDFLHSNYDIEIDKSGSDVCRLCFVSYDPQILVKEEIIPFDFLLFKNKPSEGVASSPIKVEPIKSKIDIHRIFKSERAIYYNTENKNSQRDRETIIKIIKYLRKKNLSITENYNNWFRVACAIANSFTFDLGKKYFLELCRLDGDLHDEYKSDQLIEYCYRHRKIGVIEFSTIVFLARQKGFKVIE